MDAVDRKVKLQLTAITLTHIISDFLQQYVIAMHKLENLCLDGNTKFCSFEEMKGALRNYGRDNLTNLQK